MDNKLLNLSIKEMGRIQRRIERIISQESLHMSRLERDADNCWQYPLAEERYLVFEEKMINLEKDLNVLSDVKDSVEDTILKLKGLLEQ